MDGIALRIGDHSRLPDSRRHWRIQERQGLMPVIHELNAPGYGDIYLIVSDDGQAIRIVWLDHDDCDQSVELPMAVFQAASRELITAEIRERVLAVLG